ncbi:crt homolog 3-like [Oscarella lobularis]|uniref:crt homolog 3-like n=1 Tax=Oscarella lobularis TaxID=121494 RepID=UPI003313B2DA
MEGLLYNSLLCTIIAALMAVVGQVGENVSLPLWLSAYPTLNDSTTHTEVSVDGYFVLTFASFSFVVIFGVITLVLVVWSTFQSAGEKWISSTDYTFPQLELFWIGFCDALNGIMVVFAASPERTSALLQTILGNFMIPLTIILRFVLLKKKPNLFQFLTALAVFGAIFFCLIPTFGNMDPSQVCAHSNNNNNSNNNNSNNSNSNNSNSNSTTGSGGESLAGRILWPLCFMFGFVPAALMNVLEERSLQRRHGVRRGQINLFFFLFCTSCYQLLTGLALFWADIIPGFGMSTSMKNFGENYHFGLSCFFGGDGCGSGTGVRGFLFIFFYAVSYIGGGLLLRYSDGATFLAVVSAMVTPLGFLFWTLFQQPPCQFSFYPNANKTTWFSLGGIVVMVPCVLLYNLQKAKKSPETDKLLGNDSGNSSEEYKGFSVNPNYVSGSGQY